MKNNKPNSLHNQQLIKHSKNVRTLLQLKIVKYSLKYKIVKNKTKKKLMYPTQYIRKDNYPK